MNQNFIFIGAALVTVGLFTIVNSQPKNGWERKAQLETSGAMASLQNAPNKVPNWPPRIGKPFPNVEFFDHEGNPFTFDHLPKKPTIVEMIAMPCAGCQAFSGGNTHGAFGGLASQSNLKSLEEYFREYTNHNLLDGEVNFVQIVVYDLKLQSPKHSDLAAWRKHFKLDLHKDAYVVCGGNPLANQVSFGMIPGVLLLDENQVVRVDSCGHHPQHDLYTKLFPAAKKMLNQK